ncbi:MAG: tRNA lysidine(34) synthetase TilS [Parachlamydiaceae bacterium]|nr:tRNA lysidine(34) synthetase TilS [Parachlamydiaceae bacterium]
MTLFFKLYQFLNQKCISEHPLLLALSGGPDSLALFYSLLEYRTKTNRTFHVAHVDHQWREESAQEAQALLELCANYSVPFHLKVLNPKELKGNLEAACREERYQFFSEIYQKHDLQAVLTGHHQNDHVETVLKRIFEGAHWSKWDSLKEENFIHGMKILRPFLQVEKKDLQQMIENYSFIPFKDSTNQDYSYLRPRLRDKILPWLNQAFGKKIEPALISISKETNELNQYFEEKLEPLLKSVSQGPWGVMLDLQSCLPDHLLEIRHLIRLFCQKYGFATSRTIIEQASIALKTGSANQLFIFNHKKLRVDRKRVYIDYFIEQFMKPMHIFSTGNYFFHNWHLNIQEMVYTDQFKPTSWKEGIQGQLQICVPIQDLTLGWMDKRNKCISLRTLRKNWSEKKIPAFLYYRFPFLWNKDEIKHEFLTGDTAFHLKNGMPCWKIELKHTDHLNQNKL